MYKDINLDRNNHLDYDEIRAYVIAENPGMTEAEREGFEASWNFIDKNGDQLISEAEAIEAPFDHLELFGLLEPAVNDNNEIEFELAVDYWTTVVAPNQRLSE